MSGDFKKDDKTLATLCSGTLGGAFNTAAPKDDAGWASCVDLDLGAAMDALHNDAPKSETRTKVVQPLEAFARPG